MLTQNLKSFASAAKRACGKVIQLILGLVLLVTIFFPDLPGVIELLSATLREVQQENDAVTNKNMHPSSTIYDVSNDDDDDDDDDDYDDDYDDDDTHHHVRDIADVISRPAAAISGDLLTWTSPKNDPHQRRSGNIQAHSA